MNRRVAALLGVVLSVAAAFAGFRWWTGDERVIRARLHGLAAALSVAEGEADLARVARLAELRGYFAPDVKVVFGGQQMVSRDAIVALLSRSAAPPGGVTVSFVDATVTVDGTARSADVYLTATLSSRDTAGGEELVDAREANLTMKKEDGRWVVAAVESAETLQRP